MGYKLKKVQIRVFFDGHKFEDVIEYQETFFNEIKSLLLYFIKFYKDSIIVPKEYLNDYALKGPN